MKYSVQNYAQALSESITEGKAADAVAKNFMALVIKNGDGMYFSKIIDEAERLLRRNGGPRKIVVRSARPLDDSVQAIARAVAEKGDTVETATDPSLIAGVVISVNDELQFDGSLRTKLEKMFSQ